MVSIIIVAILSFALGYCIHKYIVPLFKKEYAVVEEEINQVSKYVQTDIAAVKEDIQKAKEEVKVVESKI